MDELETLFGKTYDQQAEAAGDSFTTADIHPNRRLLAEVVFEPVVGGVRVTARDGQHHMLWGFVGSIGMMTQIHTPVAIYDTLRTLLSEELVKTRLPVADAPDIMQSAKDAIESLRDTLRRLERSLDVKKVEAATRDRAKAIASTVNDARRQIHLEISVPKG